MNKQETKKIGLFGMLGVLFGGVVTITEQVVQVTETNLDTINKLSLAGNKQAEVFLIEQEAQVKEKMKILTAFNFEDDVKTKSAPTQTDIAF